MKDKFKSPTIENERKLWNKLLYNGSLDVQKNCPLCQTNVYLYYNIKIYNPYIGRFFNSKCRKYIYLRVNIFYNYFLK